MPEKPSRFPKFPIFPALATLLLFRYLFHWYTPLSVNEELVKSKLHK